MSLIDRLAGIDPDDNKIAVHTFWSALSEFADGEVTKQQIVTYFGLDSVEETELDWLIGLYTAQPDAASKAKFIELLHVVFILAESNVPGYTTNAQLTARLNAI